MDRATVDVYEQRAGDYVRLRRAYQADDAEAFATALADGARRVDLGCGPGHYTALLGQPVVAVDAASAMLLRVRQMAPIAPLVQADLEAMPFRAASFAGAWACKCYQHLHHKQLPMGLADLHHCVAVDGRVDMVVFEGSEAYVSGQDDEFPGRYFALWSPDRLIDVSVGAGFEVVSLRRGAGLMHLTLRRLRTLPDMVGPNMRMLVCGLNPSLLSADVGVGFARSGNRFWPAALAAGLVSRVRDPRHALRHHGIGMTDLVKRASISAADITKDEYQAGLARVERLCRWLQPAVVCFVGLAGWRCSAGGREARPGLQPGSLGGVPVYVMPSTSGLNAHSRLDDLTAHLRAARGLA